MSDLERTTDTIWIAADDHRRLTEQGGWCSVHGADTDPNTQTPEDIERVGQMEPMVPYVPASRLAAAEAERDAARATTLVAVSGVTAIDALRVAEAERDAAVQRAERAEADLARVTAERDELDARWKAELAHANKWARKFYDAEADLATARQERDALRDLLREARDVLKTIKRADMLRDHAFDDNENGQSTFDDMNDVLSKIAAAIGSGS